MNDLDPNVTPDDEPNPQHELASAYLDGEASPAGRARVQSSAVLRSLVDSFAHIRNDLADVPPAPSAVREAAFAAAFAEFDADADTAPVAAAAAASAPGAAVVALPARRRLAGPLLSAAAAVLLVGVIGVALANRGGNDSTSSGATDAPAELEMSSAADTQSAPPAAGPVSTIGSITGGGEVATIIDTPEQLQAMPLPDALSTAPAMATTTTVATTTVPSAQPADTAAAETTAAGGSAEDSAKVAGGAPVTGALACLTAQQVYLGDIMYQGTYAIAARDTVTGVTQAITDDCTVLVSVGS